MRLLLGIGILLITGGPALAQEKLRAPAAVDEHGPPRPDARLVDLDSLLLKVEEDKLRGRIEEEQYQEFLSNFRTDLETARRLVKDTPPNAILHASILSRLGDSQQASAALGRALDSDPGDPALRVALSQVRFEAKDYPAALAEANAVLVRDPANKAALALKYSSEGRIGTGHASTGKPESSRSGDGWDFSIPGKSDISPQAQTLLQQAIAARRDGDMERSWKNIQAAMNADPTSTGVQKIYLLAQKDQAKHAQAKDYILSSQAAQPLHHQPSIRPPRAACRCGPSVPGSV